MPSNSSITVIVLSSLKIKKSYAKYLKYITHLVILQSNLLKLIFAIDKINYEILASLKNVKYQLAVQWRSE